MLQTFFDITFFMLGASIGSFLNVAMWRIPRGLSVNEPKRSFCPSCKVQIPFYLNIPIFAWILLCGKCKFCKCPIHYRYILMEVVCGLISILIWRYVS